MAKKTSKLETSGRAKRKTRVGAKPRIDSRVLTALCKRYGIRKLWLYGSILRSDFRPGSDVDVLVETDHANRVGLFKLGGLQHDLVSVVGRSVHLTTLGSVPEHLRSGLLSSARLEYVA